VNEDELTRVMGIGAMGEVRRGPDGGLYQWVQGVDGLGNPIGFWRALRRRLRRAVRSAVPLFQRVAPFVPGLAPAAAALRMATPILQQAGATGDPGLGALYQAPDGSLYRVQGFAEDEELRGFAEDEELRGFAEDEELRGFAEDEELRGFAEDEELRGFAQGYVRQDVMSGLEAYMPQEPPQTRWFNPPASPPEMWKPLW
jgi:hypothetical protein